MSKQIDNFSEKLMERWELAERRCSEVLDLDQDPPIKYTAIYARTARAELDELKQLVAQELSILEQKHRAEVRKRCLLFGCVFGIPMIDKEPRKECMFCGEPGYVDQDTWVNESPMENMQKTINELVSKYKTPEAIKSYLDSLTTTTSERNT